MDNLHNLRLGNKGPNFTPVSQISPEGFDAKRLAIHRLAMRFGFSPSLAGTVADILNWGGRA